MAYFVGNAVVGQPTDVDSVLKNPLGTETRDNEGNVHKYLQGVANTVAGAWVVFDEAFLTTGIDTDVAASLIGDVAVANAAIVADKFGWYKVEGTVIGLAGDIADNAKVFASSTVFRVDDAAVVGAQIIGAVSRSVDTSGTTSATFQIHRPKIGIADLST